MIDFCFQQQQPFTCHMQASLPDKGVSVVFAPSGSGKTTLLRFFAGLLRKATGQQLVFKGQSWQDNNQFMPPHKRPVACVFQQHNLLSHLNVRQNLNYAARSARGTPMPVGFYDAVIDAFRIGDFMDNYESQLSGGEQQRVALARSLLQLPAWLLLDEPMTGIDNAHKKQLLDFIKACSERFAMPVLYISHQIDEVIQVGDHLLLLENGAIIGQGPLMAVINRYQPFDDHQQGVYQLLEAQVVQREDDITRVQADQLRINLSGRLADDQHLLRLKVNARDVSISLVKATDSSILNSLPCCIESITCKPHDHQCLLGLQASGTRLYAQISLYSCKQLQLTVGMQVYAQIKATALINSPWTLAAAV